MFVIFGLFAGLLPTDAGCLTSFRGNTFKSEAAATLEPAELVLDLVALDGPFRLKVSPPEVFSALALDAFALIEAEDTLAIKAAAAWTNSCCFFAVSDGRPLGFLAGALELHGEAESLFVFCLDAGRFAGLPTAPLELFVVLPKFFASTEADRAEERGLEFLGELWEEELGWLRSGRNDVSGSIGTRGATWTGIELFESRSEAVTGFSKSDALGDVWLLRLGSADLRVNDFRFVSTWLAFSKAI